MKAFPGPCKNTNLECFWEDPSVTDIIRDKYVFKYMFILESQSLILVQASVKKLTFKSIFLDLPSEGHKISERHIKRYSCVDIQAKIFQHGFKKRNDFFKWNLPDAFS